MSQITPNHSTDDPRDVLDRNIQKTVAISTLRKIRGIVDEYDEEQRFKRRASRWAAAIFAALFVCAVIVLLATGGLLPRSVSGALTMFRGSATAEVPFRAGEPNRFPLGAVVRRLSLPDYHAAKYEEDWRRHVEAFAAQHIGELAPGGLRGNLTMTAAIRPDGALEQVKILVSSGNPEVDESAKRVVTRAAPYAPLPDDVRREDGTLHITRVFTWAR